jgi:hypothetical protein
LKAGSKTLLKAIWLPFWQLLMGLLPKLAKGFLGLTIVDGRSTRPRTTAQLPLGPEVGLQFQALVVEFSTASP